MSTSGELPSIILNNCCFCIEPTQKTLCPVAGCRHLWHCSGHTQVTGCTHLWKQALVCAPHTSPSARLHAAKALPAQCAGNSGQPPNIPQPDRAAATLASSTTLIRNLASMTAVVALGACGIAFMMRGFPRNWGEARKELKELIQHDVDLRVRPAEGRSELLLHGVGKCMQHRWVCVEWQGLCGRTLQVSLLVWQQLLGGLAHSPADAGPSRFWGVLVGQGLLPCTCCATRGNDLQRQPPWLRVLFSVCCSAAIKVCI